LKGEEAAVGADLGTAFEAHVFRAGGIEDDAFAGAIEDEDSAIVAEVEAFGLLGAGEEADAGGIEDEDTRGGGEAQIHGLGAGEEEEGTVSGSAEVGELLREAND